MFLASSTPGAVHHHSDDDDDDAASTVITDLRWWMLDRMIPRHQGRVFVF